MHPVLDLGCAVDALTSRLAVKATQQCGVPLGQSDLLSKHGAVLIAAWTKKAGPDQLVRRQAAKVPNLPAGSAATAYVRACAAPLASTSGSATWLDSASVAEVRPRTRERCSSTNVTLAARVVFARGGALAARVVPDGLHCRWKLRFIVPPTMAGRARLEISLVGLASVPTIDRRRRQPASAECRSANAVFGTPLPFVIGPASAAAHQGDSMPPCSRTDLNAGGGWWAPSRCNDSRYVDGQRSSPRLGDARDCARELILPPTGGYNYMHHSAPGPYTWRWQPRRAARGERSLPCELYPLERDTVRQCLRRANVTRLVLQGDSTMLGIRCPPPERRRPRDAMHPRDTDAPMPTWRAGICCGG